MRSIVKQSTQLALAVVVTAAFSTDALAQKGGIIANNLAKTDADKLYAEAQGSPTPQDPYLQSLHRNFQRLADYEYNQMEDYISTIFYSNRTLEASAGPVLPQSVDDRDIDPEFHGELQANRERLMTALDEGGREALPDAAGHATALYDCWLEQQEEDSRPQDTETCRDRFLREMQNLERALAARAAIADTSEIFQLDADVLFAFDDATLKDEAAEALKLAADAIREADGKSIVVVGHTDSTGDSLYNMGLSERRADSVHDYLVSLGIEDEQMLTVAFGETQPIASNDTPEGRAANRRVVVRASN